MMIVQNKGGKIVNMFDVNREMPPPLPTLVAALMEMSGCQVVTNVNRGLVYGNNKNKERVERFGKKKGGARGAAIRL